MLVLVLAAIAKNGAFGHAIFFTFSPFHFQSILEIIQKKGWWHSARVWTAGHWRRRYTPIQRVLASIVPERRRKGIVTAILLMIVLVGFSLVEHFLVLLVKQLAARIMVSGHRVDLEVLIEVFAGARRCTVVITVFALVHLGLE